VANFASKLKLSCEGLDPRKELSFLPASTNELILLFGKRHQNGWKVCATESLRRREVDKLLKFYTVMCVHSPTNGDYLAIFLRGWLFERKGLSINWA
jgi:hypothetical protein